MPMENKSHLGCHILGYTVLFPQKGQKDFRKNLIKYQQVCILLPGEKTTTNNFNFTNFLHSDWLSGRLYTSIKAMHSATLHDYVAFQRRNVDVTTSKRHENNG